MILSEGEKIEGIDLFLPAPQEIVWSLIFLVIFVVAFMMFIYPRFTAVLDERSEKIEGGIRKAEKAKAEAAELKAQQEAQIAEARQEAAAIREKARQDGVAIVEAAKQRAEAESERILTAGRQQLEAERISASAQLRGEVGTLASDLASKIVGESLSDDERSRRVIDRFLDDLESVQPVTR